MKKLSLIFICIFFVIGFCLMKSNSLTSGNNDKKDKIEKAEAGKKAPDFTLKTPDGKSEINLDKYSKDKTVLMIFYGSWCPVCKKDIKGLKNIEKEYSKKDVILLSISEEKKNPEESVKKYIKDNKITWETVIDTKKDVYELYDLEILPSYVIIDKKGSISEIFSGSTEEDTFKKSLDKLLEKKKEEPKKEQPRRPEPRNSGG